MKNMYAILNAAIKAGQKKSFVIGFVEGSVTTFTEADTLNDAKRVKAAMTAEGHKPFIDVYTR